MTKKKNNRKSINIFTFLNAINYKNKVSYDKKVAPAYLLTMWLAHDPTLLELSQKINHLQFTIPDDIIYQYYWYKVPKGRRFIKWTKKTEKEKNREKKIQELMSERKLSKREATMVLDHTEAIK